MVIMISEKIQAFCNERMNEWCLWPIHNLGHIGHIYISDHAHKHFVT